MATTQLKSSFFSLPPPQLLLPLPLPLLLLPLLLISSSSGNYNCGLVLVMGKLDDDYDYSRADFPPEFVFGAGTSAYQVEGAALEDGRTPSIFDTFAHKEYSLGSEDVSSDGYQKYKEDVQLMVDTGLEGYRFSISWSRLIPNGTGPVNPKGLQFYNNLINELISNGYKIVRANICMLHYCPNYPSDNYLFPSSRNPTTCYIMPPDLPQILEDRYGGWLDQQAVNDFTSYADVCFREFGDRVSYWTTLNEPNIFAMGGYDQGVTQPSHFSPPFGIRKCASGNSTYEPYLAAHNLLLAHVSAARLYQNKYKAKQHGFIGLNLVAFGFVPKTNSTEDTIATQRAIDFLIGWFAHPLVFGDYPEIMKKNADTRIPAFTKQESIQVKGSADFIALNHYITLSTGDKSSNLNMDSRDYLADTAVEVSFDTVLGKQDMYPVNPSGLQAVLEYFKDAYDNPPIYIHENGQTLKCDSELNDMPRVEYLQAYIRAVLNAIRNGSNTRGYFCWSFIDVFEMLYGYDSAFGLYYVDREDKDMRRYPKLSAQWYSNFLKGRNISGDDIFHQVEGKNSASS